LLEGSVRTHHAGSFELDVRAVNRAQTNDQPTRRNSPSLLFELANDKGGSADGLTVSNSHELSKMGGQRAEDRWRGRTVVEHARQEVDGIGGSTLSNCVGQIPDWLLGNRRNRHLDILSLDWLTWVSQQGRLFDLLSKKQELWPDTFP
jgi:hypothetical protein